MPFKNSISGFACDLKLHKICKKSGIGYFNLMYGTVRSGRYPVYDMLLVYELWGPLGVSTHLSCAAFLCAFWEAWRTESTSRTRSTRGGTPSSGAPPLSQRKWIMNAVLRIRRQIRSICMFLGILAPDPSIIKQIKIKIARKTFIPTVLWLLYDFSSLKNVNVALKSNKQKN
jgi:hypothetical protein